MNIEAILRTHPQPTGIDREPLVRCIDACLECGPTCTGCADASLAEADVQDLVRCIRLCLDCAESCETTARILIRQTTPDLGVVRAAVEACAAACHASGQECERHAAHHEHCRLCAEACRRCEQACKNLLAALA
jgi:hypothetical protein